jgi:hypothetical protein
VKVVGHEAPGVDDEVSILAQFCHAVQKIFPVLIGPENVCPFDAPAHDVMQSSRRIQSWLSRHTDTLLPFTAIVKLF